MWADIPLSSLDGPRSRIRALKEGAYRLPDKIVTQHGTQLYVLVAALNCLLCVRAILDYVYDSLVSLLSVESVHVYGNICNVNNTRLARKLEGNVTLLSSFELDYLITDTTCRKYA